jgi:hypothetical protein
VSLLTAVKHELKQVGLVTLYFLFCFAIVLTLKKLFLAEYAISEARVEAEPGHDRGAQVLEPPRRIERLLEGLVDDPSVFCSPAQEVDTVGR